MTERFTYDNGVWDNNVEDMADALLSEKECCDLLNALHEENQRYRYIINKQERTLADHINSKYKCALCGLVGFIGEQFIKELKR